MITSGINESSLPGSSSEMIMSANKKKNYHRAGVNEERRKKQPDAIAQQLTTLLF